MGAHFCRQSRVAECQRRVHDLIDLRVCSAGVDAAIKAHDYETGMNGLWNSCVVPSNPGPLQRKLVTFG